MNKRMWVKDEYCYSVYSFYQYNQSQILVQIKMSIYCYPEGTGGNDFELPSALVLVQQK